MRSAEELGAERFTTHQGITDGLAGDEPALAAAIAHARGAGWDEALRESGGERFTDPTAELVPNPTYMQPVRDSITGGDLLDVDGAVVLDRVKFYLTVRGLATRAEAALIG